MIPDIRWTLNVVTCVLVRGRPDTHRRGRGSATMDAETGVIQLQATESSSHQKLEEARKDALLSPQREHHPADTLLLF